MDALLLLKCASLASLEIFAQAMLGVVSGIGKLTDAASKKIVGG
jgi:hypothetical protein